MVALIAVLEDVGANADEELLVMLLPLGFVLLELIAEARPLQMGKSSVPALRALLLLPIASFSYSPFPDLSADKSETLRGLRSEVEA